LISLSATESPSCSPHSQVLNDFSHVPLHKLVQAFDPKFDRRLVHLNMVFQQSHLLILGALEVWYATQAIRIVGLVHVVQKHLHDLRVFVVEVNATGLSWLGLISDPVVYL